ncbi:MAG: hypothetical protein Q9167_007983 [Letrouitia subvulpina]
MRISYFLAAALSMEMAFSFPSLGLEPLKGKTLIARMTPGSGRSRGGSRGHEEEDHYTGYRGGGTYHPEAAANSRHFVRRVVRRGEEIVPRERYHPPIVRDTPSPGTTAVRSEFFSDREPRHTVHFGTDTGDHLDGMLYREDAHPSSRTAEYRRASPGDRRNRRHGQGGTLQHLPGNRDLRGDSDSDSEGGRVDAVHEEKGPAGLQSEPVRWDGDYPGLTVIQGSGTASRRRDGPLLNAGYSQMDRYGGTMSFVANPPRDYSPGPVAPLRGPRVDGYPTPYHELQPESSYTTRRRSRSPYPEDNGYTVRSTRDYRPRDYRDRDYDYDRRYRSKRDVVDQATKKQTHADSATQDDNKADDAKQEYQEYLQAYDAVRINATNLIMPYIENMVNGSNSATMWDAAWEIASLADPEIIVVGGVFSHGMHAMDFYEDEAMNKTDNKTMSSYFAIDEVLITQYQDTWNKCYKALNSSGMLHDLDVLQAALWTNDTTLGKLELDTGLTKDVNDFFINGPNSTLAGDDEIDWSKVNSAEFGNSTTVSTTNTTLASPRKKIVSGEKKGTATGTDAGTSTLATSVTGTVDGTSTSASSATASSK